MSNDFASDFYPDTIRKDVVGDLLGGNFDDQPLSTVRGPMKRDQDSTDDFEHLEQEFSMRESSRPPNLEIDSNSTISQRLENAADIATRNLLDTSVPAFEPELRPVPATPPPSANSDEMNSDSFQSKETTKIPIIIDPKAASLAFMANERANDKDNDDIFITKDDDPLGKFDFTSSESKISDLSSTMNFNEPDEFFMKKDDFLTREIPEILKHDDIIVSDEKDIDFDIMKSLDEKSMKKDVDVDESWNLVGKSKFDEAPTKPLPPVPQFDSFDPYNKSSFHNNDKYEMSNEFLIDESMKNKGKQSGNETGDSEFESEPEPSPIRNVTNVNKTEIRQNDDIYRRVNEKKIKEIEVVAPGDIFGSLGLVAALIYWRDPKKSGIVFGAILGVLLSLAYFSLISVLAYTSLLTLTGTVAFRIYKAVMQAVQKTSDGHPFKNILDLDLKLPAERVHEVADVAVANANAAVSELRRLFLVEDLVDTLKFGGVLWCLTYLGSWFNGMTLVIIGVVALFTLPKVYETNKAQIDQNLALVQTKINDITTKVKAAIPLGKKAEPTKEE
ncbi:reticulon-1-B isoform X2 [Leptopilina boulardi]|uniref:reticulon-1-B isoform X2 n=1 Tax=Leptopilina boulardi TaxID=63433 RepID=UPI0021F51093|nr:reticulon-1-B isoform X2 [Leptopilina boulardi]